MLCYFQRFIMPLLISTIVFMLSMLEADAVQEHGEWAPQLYGHFFPILQDGANSLSMQMDLWKFTADYALFYMAFLLLFNWLKPKFNKTCILLTTIVFLLVTSFFTRVISIDFSFANIQYAFDYATIKSMWN